MPTEYIFLTYVNYKSGMDNKTEDRPIMLLTFFVGIYEIFGGQAVASIEPWQYGPFQTKGKLQHFSMFETSCFYKAQTETRRA